MAGCEDRVRVWYLTGRVRGQDESRGESGNGVEGRVAGRERGVA